MWVAVGEEDGKMMVVVCVCLCVCLCVYVGGGMAHSSLSQNPNIVLVKKNDVERLWMESRSSLTSKVLVSGEFWLGVMRLNS